jgi:deoxycytidylate deaminase
MQLAEYLREAYRFAAQSKDPSNQNGAVLVSDNKIIAFGNNNFPVGVEFTKKRSEPVGGTTMVVPWAACCDCARAIIISGVSIVVMHRERMSMTPERWQGSVNEALEMMKEAGVQLVYHDGPVEGAPDVFVNGESWNPADEPKTEFGNWFVELGEVR